MEVWQWHLLTTKSSNTRLPSWQRAGQASASLIRQETKSMLALVGRAIKEIIAMKIHFIYHLLPEAGCEYCRNMR
jgi:hypothetical protein